LPEDPFATPALIAQILGLLAGESPHRRPPGRR
jgi:hypothetical protein